MGASAKRPELSLPEFQNLGVSNIQGGDALLNDIRSRMGQGLNPQIRGIMERQGLGQISGMMSAGRNQINQLAGENLPASARLGATSKLYSQGAKATTDLNENILLADANARERNFQSGVGNILGVQGLGANIGNMKNQFNIARTGMGNQNALQMYGIDKQNEFSWGDAVSGLLQGGGAVGAALAGRPSKGMGASAGGG